MVLRFNSSPAERFLQLYEEIKVMQGDFPPEQDEFSSIEPASEDLRETVKSVLEAESNGDTRKLELDQEDVDAVLAADGDGNPVHGPYTGDYPSDARDVFSTRVPGKEFSDFQAEVYEVMDPFADPLGENRPVLPGMTLLEHIGYSEDRGIASMDITWNGAAHHSATTINSDTQLIERDQGEESAVYQISKKTPSGQIEETAEANITYGGIQEFNDRKTALAGAFVARRDRAGDFLVSLDIDFSEEIDWAELDYSVDEILYVEENRTEERFNTTGGRILTDNGDELAEVQETYGEIPGYDEIWSKYSEPKSPAARATEAYFNAWESWVKASNPFITAD